MTHTFLTKSIASLALAGAAITGFGSAANAVEPAPTLSSVEEDQVGRATPKLLEAAVKGKVFR